MEEKTYVRVVMEVDEKGETMPRRITLHEQGYEVSRVHEARLARECKAGGRGMRYLVSIGHRRTYLFQEEEGRWYVQEKAPAVPDREGA